MGNFSKVVGAAVIVLGSAIAASAHVDVPKLTCADFAGLAEVDELNASGDVLAWIADAANANAADGLIAKYGTNSSTNKPWRPEEMHVEIEGHCIDAPAGATVIDRLKSHS